MSIDTPSSLSTTDMRYLRAASRLSRRHEGMTGTNPSVGCLIIADTGFGPVVAGTGVTAAEGRPHAERIALEEAGPLAKGATAYVTLEPCSHQGKTTPCVDALIAAGVARVVSGMRDPDPRVDGQGHANLGKAGVSVSVAEPDDYVRRPLDGYLLSKCEHRPFVTLKLAMTENGVMGRRKRGNTRITCPDANRQTHLMRARHDAILVGMGTVRADDPMLNCRLPGLYLRSPVRVVVSSSEFPAETFRIFKSADAIPTIWAGIAPDPAMPGVDTLEVSINNARVDLTACLAELHQRGMQSVMVEGGSAIATSLLEAQLVDELVIHLGGAPDLGTEDGEFVIAPVSPSNLPDGFELCEKRTFGTDQALRYRRS